MMPLPEKFMERMRRELGAAEADALCAALKAHRDSRFPML